MGVPGGTEDLQVLCGGCAWWNVARSGAWGRTNLLRFRADACGNGGMYADAGYRRWQMGQVSGAEVT